MSWFSCGEIKEKLAWNGSSSATLLLSKGQRKDEEAIKWDAQCHLRASVVYPHKSQHVNAAAMRAPMTYLHRSRSSFQSFVVQNTEMLPSFLNILCHFLTLFLPGIIYYNTAQQIRKIQNLGNGLEVTKSGCEEAQAHTGSLKEPLLFNAGEAVIISQCMLSSRNSIGTALGNNKLSSPPASEMWSWMCYYYCCLDPGVDVCGLSKTRVSCPHVKGN